MITIRPVPVHRLCPVLRLSRFVIVGGIVAALAAPAWQLDIAPGAGTAEQANLAAWLGAP